MKKQDAESGPIHTPDVGLGRRDLMKIGAGAVMTTLVSKRASAQEGEAGSAKTAGSSSQPTGLRIESGAGMYKNDAGRISGNGPMDSISRQLVSYATSFSEANLTEPLLTGIGNTMLDSVACIIAGFESEPGRIGARIGRSTQSDMKSTILGYGITTTPENAAFANSSMVRHTDYNDGDPEHGGHNSVIIPGILAIGEALHSTGSQVLVSIALGYEILNCLGHASRAAGWDAPYEGLATALAAGKLMGFNEDRLGNALSLALVPHMPLAVTHVGALSHWKGCHSAMGVRAGVYAALLAREGMTGPAQPFEGRNGLLDRVTGQFKELRLPVSPDGRLGVENFRMKRYPAEGNAQALLQQAIPPIREWTKANEIASIRVEMPFGAWQEIADPPKWDPQNRETADHSLAYLMSVALTDGEVYLSSFTPERYLHDASLRQLMAKINCQANPEFDRAKQGRVRITVRKTSGQELVKEVYEENPVTHDEVIAKFNRVCAYKGVSAEQKDRGLATWPNLQKVHDIGEPVRNLASFGKPLPL